MEVLIAIFVIWLIYKGCAAIFYKPAAEKTKSNSTKSKAKYPSKVAAAANSFAPPPSISGSKTFIGVTAVSAIVVAYATESVVYIALGVCIIFFFLYRIKSGTEAGAAGLLPNGEYAKHAVIYIYIILLCDVSYLLTRLSDESWRDPLGSALLVGYYFSILAAVFYFLRWFKRAYYNLHIKKQNLRFAAGWAVGAWFVPILNLLRPVEVMQELYDETAELLKNKQTTLAAKLGNSGWVIIWWVICIINAVIFIGVLIVTTAVYATISSEFTVFMIIHHFAVIALSAASLKVIKDYSAAETLLSSVEEEKPIATSYVAAKGSVDISSRETPKVAVVKAELTPIISVSRHEREKNIADTHKPAEKEKITDTYKPVEKEEAEPPLLKTPADQPFKEKLSADYNSGDKNAFYSGYQLEFFSVQKQGGEPVFKSNKNGYYMAVFYKGSYYVTPKFSLIYNADYHTACSFGAVFGIFKCDAVYDRVELVTPAVFTKEGDVWTLVQQGELDLSHRK